MTNNKFPATRFVFIIKKAVKEKIISYVATFRVSAALVTAFPNYQPPPGGGAPVTSVTTVFNRVLDIVDFMQAIFWIAAAGFGLYAAFLYLTSGGSPEGIKKAKDMLIYTVVAIFVAIIAFGLPMIITNFLTG